MSVRLCVVERYNDDFWLMNYKIINKTQKYNSKTMKLFKTIVAAACILTAAEAIRVRQDDSADSSSGCTCAADAGTVAGGATPGAVQLDIPANEYG